MKLAAHVSFRRKTGPALRGGLPERRCWQRLPVALACAALCTTALPAILDWAGTAPVLLASGDFGYGYTTMEFQYGLDWQGFCNSHPTAICTNITYWGIGANWSGGALPSFADDVRTPVGSLIVVGSYPSSYHGYIEAFGTANYMNAQGTLAIGFGGRMILGSADINDLRFSGLLQSDGRINISSISGDNGRITGAGTTFVQSIASPSFSVEVRQTQHFTLGAGVLFEGSLRLYGFEQATIENTGHLSTKANNDFSILLAGSSNFKNSGTLSAINEVGGFYHNREVLYGVTNHVHNTGLVEGAFTFDGVRFDNDGTVRLQRSLLKIASASATSADLSTFLALGGGSHTGLFQADAGTLLGFSGSFAAGHLFLPGSNIQSAGSVIFGKGVASVQGGYSAADTVIGTGAASVAFSGNQASFGTLTVNGASDVTFSGHEASFSTVTVNANGSATFATAQPVFIPVLNMAGGARFATQLASAVQTAHVGVGGNLSSEAPLVVTGLLGLDGGTVSHVDVHGALRWVSGALGGSVIRGSNTWLDGSRSLFGDVTAQTDTLWQGGNFTYWSNTYLNPVGRTVDLQGDFGIAGGGGRFDNRGTFRKSAGDGVASLGIAFDNSGSVIAERGTLVLGGGRQSGSLVAKQGAMIVLGGSLDITPLLVNQGRIDVNANTMRVLEDASYINAADAAFSVAAGLTVSGSGTFVNNGTAYTRQLDIQSGGTCPTNCGFVFNAGTMRVASFDNAGTLVNGAGATTLTLGDYGVALNGVNRPGATVDNLGSLQLHNIRLSNQGDINNRGVFRVDADSFLTGTGVITNRSQLTNNGSVVLTGTGRFDNHGQFDTAGRVLIDTNASLAGPGRYRQTGGRTTVDGLLQSGGDIAIDSGVLNGIGTVQGNVVLGPTGVIMPGHSPGLLTVDGNLTFADTPPLPNAAPNLEIEVASPASFDVLRVTGAVNLNLAVVEFRFLAGYVPKDGDSVSWLQAGRIVDNCQPWVSDTCPVFQTAGLPTDWTVIAAKDGNRLRLEVINEPATLDMSTQIIAANALTIAAGAIATNWTEDPYNTALRSLDNSGALYNRPNAWLEIDSLYNRAGGVTSNRGTIVNSVTLNEGILRIRPGAEFVNTWQFTNTGEVANHGLMTTFGTVLNTGNGRFDNSGTLSTRSLTNNSAASFDSSGLLDLVGNAAVRNEGQFTVSGRVQGGNEILNVGGTFTVTTTGVVQALDHCRDVQGLTHVDGRLEATSIMLEFGRVEGQGTLAGATSFINEKLVLPTTPSVLTVEGDLSLHQLFGFYEVELANSSLYTGLHVTGKVHVLNAMQVQFLLIDGYLPQLGDSFNWMSAAGGFDGEAIASGGIYSLSMVNGQALYTGWTPPDGMQVSFESGRIGFIAAVPEPATWLLWLACGMVALPVATRRRRLAASPSRMLPTGCRAC